MRCSQIIVLLTAVVAATGCRTLAPRSSVDEGNPGAPPAGFAAGAPPADRGQPGDRPAESVEIDADAELGDYLAYAALHSPKLEAAFNRWKAAVERVPQVSALPDPRLSYRYYIRAVETRVGPQRQGFGLSQTFPWIGKLELRGDAAAQAARAERHRYEAERLKLFRRVKDAYYEYAWLDQAARITRRNLDLLTQIEQVARQAYEGDRASYADVIRAQVEHGKLSDRLESLEDLRGPIAARLNAALNRPPGAPLGNVRPDDAGSVELDDQRLAARLEEHNPELAALAREAERAEREVDLARKAYFPDVTLGVDYIDTGDSIGGRHPDDDGKDPVVAMASINLPIWWDKLAAGVREAKRRRAAVVSERRQRANDLQAELKMALYDYRDAKRKIGLYRDTLIPQARQALESSRTAFSAGKAAFADAVDAERVLLEFELSYERARADRAQALARIEELLGASASAPGRTPASQPVAP